MISKYPVNDPQGGNPKPRRFVVYRIIDSETFWGIGISSNYEPRNPLHIKLPVNSKTGLSWDSGAICDDWLDVYYLSEFERIGHCPVKEMTLIHEAIMKMQQESTEELQE